MAIACGLVFFLLYVVTFMRFVRTIEIPSKGTVVQVSVGIQRTEFAKANFNSDSDWEILRDRGTDEEQVWKLWTARSLVLCRFALYTTYSLCLLSLVAAFSWGVLAGLKESDVSARAI
jgi:hypothetical protein